jgi:archaellum biogenesis ATPase FlaH
MIEALQSEQDSGTVDTPFGPNMESGIISLLLDFPELFVPTSKFITMDLFTRPEVKYVVGFLKQDFDKFGVLPTRSLLHDRIAKLLTADDPHQEILSVVDRVSDPREAPFLRQSLRDWVEHKSYEQLYSDEAIAAHQRGDHEFLRKIVDSASSISMVGNQGFWFFDQIDEIFADTAIEHISTGFPGLDANLNEGGPSTGEVLIILAPTGVGKTLTLINMAHAAMLEGHNVLFVTFELSTYKTAIRLASCMSMTEIGAFTRANIDSLPTEQQQSIRDNQTTVRNRIQSKRGQFGELVIYELPPDECSVNDIYGIIETNRKTKGWEPKVVVLDYLELMNSRHSHNNDEGDYTRQKSVATEMRGLAKNEKVLVYSATQTNRGGVKNGGGAQGANGKPAEAVHIDLDKAAESFGKAMPVDYVVSLNQTEDEYRMEPAIIRLWIAKNRNGPKFVPITTNVFYKRMGISEVH